MPNWTLATLKFIGPVVVAVAIGYARFITLENRSSIIEQRSKDTDIKAAALETLVGAMDRRLNTSEVKQQVLEKDLSASLARIEATVKDVQIDMKDLQKQHNAPK